MAGYVRVVAAIVMFSGIVAGCSVARAEERDESRLARDMPGAVEGEDDSADEFETKHLFGFTEGVDVGTAGEREAESETSASIGKAGGGRYGAVEQEATLEFVPTSRFSYELSLHGVSQVMTNAPGLANLGQTSFSGFSFNPKYIVLKRGVDAPFGLAVSMTPEWDRLDPVIGAHANNFLTLTKLHLDAEVIEKKLYFGSNILFSPEVDNEKGSGISQYGLFGMTGALAWRIAPNVGLGAEVEHYVAYNSLGFSNSLGTATYFGPTFSVQINPKAYLATAWSSQIGGKPVNGSATALANYNQSDFARQRARVIFEYQY